VGKPIKNKCLFDAVLGKNSDFIVFDRFERPVHQSVVAPLIELKSQANNAGFDLALASGYRSFDRQLAIWNEKATGRRVVLDVNENPIDIDSLSAKERVFAILRWSALPGASRHHWGSDIDIFDASALQDVKQLQLTNAETKNGGPFEAFYRWLTPVLEKNLTSFVRPYAVDCGGVAPEPWHLSYAPLADKYFDALNIELLTRCIENAEIALKQEILSNIDEIFHRFVLNNEF